jgi:hypothetical protein
MKEQLINLETAKLAKEKGFCLRQDKRYIEIVSINSGFVRKMRDKDNPFGKWIPDPNNVLKSIGDIFCTNADHLETRGGDRLYGYHGEAPTQALLQKWLRDIHILYPFAWCNGSGWGWELETTSGTHISVMDMDGGVEGTEPESGMFKSYEEALERGLQEALKLVVTIK